MGDSCEGLLRDPARAVALCQQGTDAGNPRARYHLALHLLEGDGVPQNLVTAETHLRTAARAGYAPAMLRLAHMHTAGQGAAPSEVEAALWFRAAADADRKSVV